MGKLFVSLYVYIIVSLLLVTGVIERLWPYEERQTPLANELGQNFQALAKSYAGRQYIDNQYSVNVIPAQSIALPDELAQRLDEQSTVHTYNHKDDIIWYVPIENNQLMQIGPVRLYEPEHALFWPYLILLLVIGAPVGLWSFLLWRDFNKLSDACAKVDGRENLEVNTVGYTFMLPITDALNVMQRRIHSLLNAQKELTSSVSHEFRTPLARLKFALAMLSEQANSTDKKYIHSMEADVTELEQLVSEMMEYARLDAQRPRLTINMVDLVQLCQNVLDKLSFNEHIQLELKHDMPCIVACDEHFISRVIQNVLVNAIKHAKTKVNITLKANEHEATMLIEDDGLGIAHNKREEIFKPFTRLDQSRDKRTGGYGLGLAICNKIMIWHQGSIRAVDSELGGAAIEVILPSR